VMLRQMNVDQILNYNKSLDQTPYTLYRETGRAKQRYYPRPFDAVFFERYRQAYGLPKPGKLPAMYKEFAPYKKRLDVDDLEQRHVMPVSQYAALLEQDKPVDQALAPDKTVELLNTLAKESLALARQAVQAANEARLSKETIAELERFVSDSQLYVLATEAMMHKEAAAILKARMIISGKTDLADAFLKRMEQSVASYRKLAELTKDTYLHGNDLRRDHWRDRGIGEFKSDLSTQRKWAEKFLNAPAKAAVTELKGKPLTWIQLRNGAHAYAGKPCRWLGEEQIELKIDVPPKPGLALDLLWGAKGEERSADGHEER